jgi:hypothetical protein
MDSQNAAILNHLKKVGPITPMEALEKYGCFRLAARIYDLRMLGHDISMIKIPVGKNKQVARYTLVMSAEGREQQKPKEEKTNEKFSFFKWPSLKDLF